MGHTPDLRVVEVPPCGDDLGGYSIEAEYGRRVAFVWPYQSTTTIDGVEASIAPFGSYAAKEDALLFTAARDLLEVCQELLAEHYLFHVEREKWICPYCLCEALFTPVNFPHSSTCPVIRARQVIAKAEGRDA